MHYQGINFDRTILVNELSHINDIIHPLKTFGIDGFFFMQIYSDGRMIDLTTHAEWAKLFFDNFYKLKYKIEDINEHICFREGVSLWMHNPHNHIWQEGNKYFQLGNGISIFKKFSSYTKIYSFFSKVDNFKINDFYVNHLNVLESFIEHFNEIAAPIIRKALSSPFLLPQNYLISSLNEDDMEKKIRKFLVKINNTRFTTNSKTRSYLLTQREKECLEWLCLGKTSDEIGIILNRSRRTIEAHIISMKTKLNCVKIAQLIYKATKLGLLDNFRYVENHDVLIQL